MHTAIARCSAHGRRPQEYRGSAIATDPVCGMQVDERTAAGSSVFEDRSYYFCSAGCKKKFEANPTAYVGTRPVAAMNQPEHAHSQAPATLEPPGDLQAKPGVASALAPGTTIYTCPMHP